MGDDRTLFTFLFTDIEGSSRLWEASPKLMALALARHDNLLNDVFSGHGGHVFKMMGDSVCVAFTREAAAVSAIIDAQRSLLGESWETATPIRVRAALHKGVAEQRNSDYFGPTLNRTARLLAAGHGGQTLLSRAAKEAVPLPDGVSLRDLGERRLRDLTSPEHIYQLVAPGLPADFPPLRSLEVLPNNLPAQVNAFIGRERDLADVKNLLGQSRLATLVGPGGAGKTRLALQVAAELLDRFPDGVWLVELATVAQADAVVQVVATSLGLREEPGRAIEETLSDYLRAKEILLILDNCEHLVGATAGLADRLLRAAPRLRILSSSREALSITGEITFHVESLSLPDFFAEKWTPAIAAARASDYEAVRLFMERAAAVQPGFKLTPDNALIVTKICWRLDGIPLAIELAAARVKMLSPEQILHRLDNRFHLLTSGGRTVMPRQQTLTALIDWSYDLLSEKERLLLLRLCVFGRGRTLQAIESVCSGQGLEEWEILDLLEQLISKSLISVEQAGLGESRYFMLESVWDYARTKLQDSGDLDRVQSRHLDYFLDLARSAEEKLTGPDQVAWLEKLTPEHVNFRLALRWSASTDAGIERGLCLAGTLLRYWEVRSHMREGYEHCMALLNHPAAQNHTFARAKAMGGAGRLAWLQDQEEVSRSHYAESIALFEELGEQREVAILHAMLGFVEWSDGRIPIAKEHFKTALEFGKAREDNYVVAIALSGLGSVARSAGDLLTARLYKIESLAAYRNIGDRWIVTLLCYSLARVVIMDADYQAARHALSESAQNAEKLGNEWLMPALIESYGEIALGEKNHALAAKLYGAAEVLRERLSLPPPPMERATYDRLVGQIRAGSAPEDFAEAWAAGRALATDEALRLALEM